MKAAVVISLFLALAIRVCWAEFTREDAAECLMVYIDGLRQTVDKLGVPHFTLNEEDKDRCADENEVQNAKEYYLNAVERAFAKLVKSNEQIMRDCDDDVEEEITQNRMRCISRTDMIRATAHCLDGKIGHMRRLDLFDSYICERARKKWGHKLKIDVD